MPLSALHAKPSSLLFYHPFVWYYLLSSKPLVYWLPNTESQRRSFCLVFAFPDVLIYLYIWSAVHLRIQLLYANDFPSVLWRHCFDVFLFAILLLKCPVLSFVKWPKFGGFPFLFPEFCNFMIMSFDITLFFTYYARYLKSPHIWNPMSFSTVFFFSFNVNDFLPTSFFILFLLSCYDQKINFPNRISEFFILLFPKSYAYLKILIAGNFCQLYLPTVLLL